MSTYLRDRAFVLSVKSYREADAWVSLWTEHHGKQEVFAAGLKRTNARQQGHLQPFALVEVMIAHGKVLQRVAVAQMTRDTGSAIRTSAAWTAIMGSVFTMCDRLTAAYADEPDVFAFLFTCAQMSERMRQSFSYERLWFIWAFALHSLGKRLGYGVSFTRCTRCEKGPIDPSSFLVKERGFLCIACSMNEIKHSSPFLTESETLRRVLQFFEQASLEEVVRLSAPRQVLADAAVILEATLTTLPIDTWQRHRKFLHAYR